LARARNYAAEYARRSQRAVAQGYQGYGHYRRSAHGAKGKSSPGVVDIDRTSTRKRIHEQVAIYDADFEDDWQRASFGSSRVNAAMYSPSRQELRVEWVNGPGGVPYPPYVYDAVGFAVWEEFRSAGSPGRFVNSTLNSFPYRPAPEFASEFG